MKHILFFFFFSILSSIDSYACTSIIVSGKASADGRPFIFKNLDGTKMDEALIVCNGERFRYVAITNNTNDAVRPSRVGSGYNETGFSIINTNGYNLNKGKADNGNNTKVMRRALEVCATLKDFETLLDTLPRPLHLNSNYGVMDAKGEIAYYEASSKGYVKYDANDPEVAPNGYLIRTNFGISGIKNSGKGYGRYKAMEMFVENVKKNGKISYKDVIRGASRYLTHGESKINLYDIEPENAGLPVFVDFSNFIPRKYTVNAQLIQGVKIGENPSETVAWTICGSPLTTVCVPIWMTPGSELPKIVSRDSNGHSPLCDAGLELKKRLFPKSKKRKSDDINIAQLINKAGTGILQQIEPVEDEIFRRSDIVIQKIRQQGYVGTEVVDLYKWIDLYVPTEYKKRFGLVNSF